MAVACDDKPTSAAGISALIDECIAQLPAKVRRRCNREQIDRWCDKYGCSDHERMFAALCREDCREAFKAHAPVVLVAKLQSKLAPEFGSDPDELPEGYKPLVEAPLPGETLVNATMRSRTRVATCAFAVPGEGHARLIRPPRLIRGGPPSRRHLDAMAPLYSCEHSVYADGFLDAIGLRRIVLCEGLHFEEQKRRDVADMPGGTLYIDVSDRAPRRSRHAFHHELWHMTDFALRAGAFEQPDPEWQQVRGQRLPRRGKATCRGSCSNGHWPHGHCTRSYDTRGYCSVAPVLRWAPAALGPCCVGPLLR